MKLESQVTSLELSKKLSELGVKQEGLFVWIIRNNKYFPVHASMVVQTEGQFYSAYTVAELGELLPEGFESHKTILPPENLSKNPDLDTSDYYIRSFGKGIYNKKEAYARAEMLIYLLENNLIKP